MVAASGRTPVGEHRYELLFTSLPIAAMVVDTGLTIVDANPAACALTQRTREELVGARWPDLVHPDERQLAEMSGSRGFQAPLDQVYRAERRLPVADGRLLRLRLTGRQLVVDETRLGIMTLEDVTAEREAQERLAHLSQHDPLTGLPSKRWLVERVETALAIARRNRQPLAVLHADLDNFKRINDGLGHDLADQVLATIGHRIGDCMPPSAIVVRLAGDEFVVAAEAASLAAAVGTRDQLGPLTTVRILAEIVLDAVMQPVVVGGQEVHLTASAGVALADQRSDAPDLLRHAAVAVRTAKREGRSRWVLAERGSLLGSAGTRLAVEAELRQGLGSGELLLHYQPLVRTNGRLKGFEALVRWNHPTRGVLAPADFLDVVDEAALSTELTHWVVAEAIAATAGLPEDMTVSVNVPVEQLRRAEFAEHVMQVLDSHGQRPERLAIEVLETESADELALSTSIERLAEHGVEFVVDDFGVAYSSLTYLKLLPITAVKIDRSFVEAVTEDLADESIVRAITAACHATGRYTVAEGVQRPDQLRLLQSLGVEVIQGDLAGTPAPLAFYAELIARGGMDFEASGTLDAGLW